MERRHFQRVVQSFDARYRTFGSLGEPWRIFRTVNVSATGLRFRSSDLIELGMTLEIELDLPCLKEPLVVRGHVVWSQAMASGVTENGAEFVDLSPEQSRQIDELVKFLSKG